MVLTPEPVMKLTGNLDDKRNKITSKKFDDNIMSTDCDVIVNFPIYDQFAAIRRLDFGRVAFKTYIFINSDLFS